MLKFWIEEKLDNFLPIEETFSNYIKLGSKLLVIFQLRQNLFPDHILTLEYLGLKKN